MNRKLINGLLMLTVSTCGVGMFTSCKDNEDSFKQDIQKQQAQLLELLDKKIQAGDQDLKDKLDVVRGKLNDLLGAGLLTEKNQEYLIDLINTNQDYAEKLKVYVDDMVVSLITSVEIQEVYNPAFGTVNLPLGIESTLLCNYYFDSKQSVSFPELDDVSTVYGDKNAVVDLQDAGLTLKGDNFTYAAGEGIKAIDNLGDIYVTVNPSTIPASVIEGLTITLEKTNGDVLDATLEPLTKEDEHIKNFGYTRAQNGFYKLHVGVPSTGVPAIALTLDEGLKSALKDLASDPSKSDLANLAKAIFDQFNGRVPAYGLGLTTEVNTVFTYEGTPWNPKAGTLQITGIGSDYTTTGGFTQDGTPGDKEEYESKPAAGANENNAILRSVYSKYSIAAVTYHPLSFSFDPSGITDRRLPEIGHIQEYVNRILDKVDLSIDLGLDADKYAIDLSGVKFTVKDSEITVDLSNTPVYPGKMEDGKLVADKNENPIGVLDSNAVVTLEYKANDPSSDLYDFVNSIVNAVNGEGNADSFVAQIQAQVNDQLKSIIDDLNSSVNTMVSDKVASIKDRINSELNGRLGDGINRLIDLYNALAKKINTILDNPNAYLQVYAAYADGNGDLHQFSGVASDPSTFTPAGGDAIEMFLTSYNAELLAPAYKKYVAVVKDLTDASADVKSINAKGEYLNTVLEGRQQRVYIPVGNGGLVSGHTYELVYMALDYRGYISARKFYMHVN